MHDTKYSRLALAAPAIVAVLILANGASAATAAAYLTHSSSHLLNLGTTTIFAGSATTLSINTPLTSLAFGATGPLDPTGGWVNAPMTEVQTDLADAELLVSVAMGSGQQAESEAAVGSLVLLPGTAYNVTADFAMSRAFATCSGVSGDTSIANLQVAGVPVTVTGAPNQVVDVLGVARLVINEQTPTSTGITINALDLSTVTGVQVLVDNAYASISCSTTTGLGLSQPAAGTSGFQPMNGLSVSGTCTDFTTGGGWIPSPPPNTGAKSTFGFVAGFKPGGTTPSGELEYHDHASSQFSNVHSLDVLFYTCGTTSNSRVFGGDAQVNHVSGYCYQVLIEDNGEPGVNRDFFQISIRQGGSCVSSSAIGFTVVRTLTSPNAQTNGHFGNSVAVSSTIVVVGAPGEGVVEAGAGAGRAYIFDATTGSVITLISPNPIGGGHFGSSVAVSSTTVVVGAPDERVGTTFGAGHTYIFATSGTFIAMLTSPTPQSGGEFGFSVGLDGVTVVVGAPGETSQAGHAYIFATTGGSPIATLTSPNSISGGAFGWSVAVSGTNVVVGAPFETANGQSAAGNAYVFTATGNPIATLMSPTAETGGAFGWSVAVSGTTILVGAPGETASGQTQAGHAYIFATTGGPPTTTLSSPTPQTAGLFGWSVTLTSSLVVVGAPGETSQAGHAYIFTTTGGSPIATLTSPNPETGGAFGNSVAISGMTVVVGAPFEDVTTTSAQTDAGRAYIFGPTTSGSTPSYTNGNFLSGGNIEIHQ